MDHHVTVVSETDGALGTFDTQTAHDGLGIRHRASMILIHNSRGEVLLCRRSHQKRLWANYWENSCSSQTRRRGQSSQPSPNDDGSAHVALNPQSTEWPQAGPHGCLG